MKFKKADQLPLLICVEPHKFRTACQGFLAVLVTRGLFLYWGYELSEYNIKLRLGRKKLERIRIFFAMFFWIFPLGIFAYFVYSQDMFNILADVDFWIGSGNWLVSLFLISVFFLSYLVYRFVVFGKKEGSIEFYNYKKRKELENNGFSAEALADWSVVEKFAKNKRKDISKAFTSEAIKILGEAYLLAINKKAKEVTPELIFFALLSSSTVSSVLLRLGVPTKILKEQFESIILTEGTNNDMPEVGEDFYQIVFRSYEKGFNAYQKTVGVTQILVATIEQSEYLQDILYKMDIDNNKLNNTVAWFILREKMYERYKELKLAGSFRSKYGIDRAMTAIATPYLNKLSEDLTMYAKYVALDPCIGRTKEFEEIFRIVEGGRRNILLVGDVGVGKRTIVEGLAQKMVENSVPDRLFDKRLVHISLASLLAGTTGSGAMERVNIIMNEVERAGNVILLIENLDELLTNSGGESLGVEVANTLAEHLGTGNFLTFSTSTPAGYKKFISGSNLGTVFEVVEVEELSNNQAIQVVESKLGAIESKNNVFFLYSAIEKAVILAKKLMHEKKLPDNALEVVAEVASYVSTKPNTNKLVTEEDVGYVVSTKTGVPTTSISGDERGKLLNLEDELHKRVIGQDNAVSLVSSALRRARAEIRSTNKPISVFLFLGPTGVGKTELAKTISSVYFGDENNMVRIDMSEYQGRESIYRLIGQPNQQGTGILTEAVMKKPFSLVLLDELEKAHKDVLNLFLQVFDDGRLTDSVGRVIDFTNTIIIATSNAGTAFAQKELNSGVDLEKVRQKLMRSELSEYFAPEFLNRFDSIVLFKPLEKEEIKQIAKLMLVRVVKDVEEKGIEFVIEDQALDSLAEIGYDPDFGARPMRRAIQDGVENKLADLLLQNKIDRGSVVTLKGGLEIEVK